MTATLSLSEAVAYARAVDEREARGEELREEAERLKGSLRDFVYAAWPFLGYPRIPETFHVDAISEHVQAAYERELRRLIITIQPGSFKSTIVSVLAPAWRWLGRPGERFITASHADELATRDTTASRTLMQGAWYQSLHQALALDWTFSEAQNLKTRYSNTKGGHRVRTHVGGGTGDRGTVLQVDDPHNAKDARYVDTGLAEAVKWWSDTAVSRLDDTVQHPGTMIVVGQRVHTDDLIGYLLASGDRWTHLCLPTRWSAKHKYRYPKRVRLRSGRWVKGDERKREDELLMPKLQDEEILASRVAEDGVTAHVWAGQYQQLPAAKEGTILKRANWRYYDPSLSFYRPGTGERDWRPFDAEEVAQLTAVGRLPVFTRIIESWDTSLKDRAHSDFVAGGVWAEPKDRPADRWLLRIWHGRAGLNETIEAMLLIAAWTDELWPKVPKFRVIERAANGPEAIAEIEGRVQGVIAYPLKGAAAQGDKRARAEAASPALDGGNCYLPGYGKPDGSDYDPRTPVAVQEFVEETSEFDTGAHDDQVDQWSQMVNYSRKPHRSKGRMSIPTGRLPSPAGMPGAR